MGKRRNTRINTLFSDNIFDWLRVEAEERGQSLAQIVREKVTLAKRENATLERIDYLEKVIKKSHSVIVEKLSEPR
ncbi:MAG: hypothetical protein R8K49_06020 [Mariprofundaceae bacterium]